MSEKTIISSSTHTRARLRMLYHWIISSNNLKIFPRTTTGISRDTVNASFTNDDGSADQYKELIHLGSYNYSGLTGHPDILDAAKNALEKYGTTTSGVRLLNGNLDIHHEFETKLASFLGTEDAVTFSSGLAANLAATTALCSEDDIVFSDELNHQSIVDELKLSRAKIVKYNHSDMNQLESLVRKYPTFQRKFIISDGVFSMDGDICQYDAIRDIANNYNAYVILDDAHAIAAIGQHGRGTASHFNLPNPDIITGSLSKGLPGIGGYVAGSKDLMNLLRYGSNQYIFSASIPAPTIAGLLKSIEILENNPVIMDSLRTNECLLRDGLNQIGLDTMNSNSPIIPILLCDRNKTFKFAERLHEEGVYVNPVPFPAVPLKKARLRINASASLNSHQIKRSLNIITSIHKEIEGDFG